jgi:hypothetical protein
MKIWVAVSSAAVLGTTLAGATAPDAGSADRRGSTPAQAAGVVERFLQSGTPALTGYRARRVLTASTRGGRMSATLEAWTTLESDGRFRFEIIRQSGSGLIRERVLVAALEAEQRSRDGRAAGQADLTLTNYGFEVQDDAREDGLVAIRLVPRRKTPMLLIGTVTVTARDGEMVRIDGSPSELPSWWTKQVDIVRRYARIAGVRVPIEMASRADVRLAGESTFSMTFEYETINGRAVDKTGPDERSQPSAGDRAPVAGQS